MDYEYSMSIINKLPNINNLLKNGCVKAFKSVFPADSIPAWITCYTGKNPSEHGVLESINYLGKDSERINLDTSIFQGKTFWDIVGNAGEKVCIINPFMAYPVWSVNGLMVNGPVFINGDVEISDPTIVGDISVPDSLGGITAFATKKTLKPFVKKIFSDTKEQVDFGLSLLKQYKPNLFFQTFLTMDRIQHFLWRYCDPKDPTYPGENEFKNSIENYYIRMDKIIGKYIDILEHGDKLMIISDHGHGMRCTHCFNINEFLRDQGYLKSSAEGSIISSKLIIEKLKTSVLNFLHKYNLEDYMSIIAKLVPNAKNLKDGKHITNNKQNKAYASNFTGTNPFGGICINKDLVKNYEQTRNEIIEKLKNIKDRDIAVFQWVLKREEMFKGEYTERYPDIIFSMNYKYGVSWNLHTKYFTENPTHKKISGGHKEHGIFLSNIPSQNIVNEDQVNITNFFSTVLNCFNIDPSKFSSAKSFLDIK